jgi:hypothetical protein
LLSPKIPNVISRPIHQLFRKAHGRLIDTVGQASFKDISLPSEACSGKLNLYALGNNRFELTLSHPTTGRELGFIQYRLNTRRNPLDRNRLLSSREAEILIQKTYQTQTEGETRFKKVGSSLKEAAIEHSVRRLGPETLPELETWPNALKAHENHGFETYQVTSGIARMRLRPDKLEQIRSGPKLLSPGRLPYHI